MKKQIFIMIIILSFSQLITFGQFRIEATGLNDMKLRTGGTDRIHILQTGNVGIGTSIPDTKLHIQKANAGVLPTPLSSTILTLENNNDGNLSIVTPANSTGSVVFGRPADLEKGWLRYNHSLNELQIGTNSIGRVYIKGGGKVGIGTSTPSYNLEVIQDSDSDNGIGLFRYGGDAPAFFGISANGNSTLPIATLINNSIGRFGGRGYDGSAYTTSRARIDFEASQNWTSTANGARMKFYTTPAGSTTSTQQMVIDHDGDVGINRTSPSAKLDVDGDIILGVKAHEALFPNSDIIALDRVGKSIIRFIGTNVTSLSGIAGGVEGMMLYLYNNDSVTLTIKHQSVTAAIENRISTGNAGADIVFSGRGGAVLVYDGANLKWRVLSYNN
jgi:hypothetical protein